MRGWAVATVLLCGLLVAASHGAAQPFPPTLFLASPDLEPAGPIAPNVGSATIVVPWTFSCTSMGSGAGTAVTPIGTLHWTLEAPDGITVTGALTENIDLPDCVRTHYVDGESRFSVAISSSAPGEQALTVVFAGVVQTGNDLQGESNEAFTVTHVVADYLGLIGVQVATPTIHLQDGTGTALVQVRNLGNSRSNVAFASDAPAHLQVQELPLITLESANQNGSVTQDDIGVDVQADGLCGEQPFTMTLAPFSTKEPEKRGTAVPVSFLVVGDDCSETAESKDSPPVAAVLPILATVALMRRRHRR